MAPDREVEVCRHRPVGQTPPSHGSPPSPIAASSASARCGGLCRRCAHRCGRVDRLATVPSGSVSYSLPKDWSDAGIHSGAAERSRSRDQRRDAPGRSEAAAGGREAGGGRPRGPARATSTDAVGAGAAPYCPPRLSRPPAWSTAAAAQRLLCAGVRPGFQWPRRRGGSRRGCSSAGAPGVEARWL